MDDDSPRPTELLLNEAMIRSWLAERGQHELAIAELDRKVAAASLLLGLPTALTASDAQVTTPATKLTRKGSPDKRREGTLTEFVLTALAESKEGKTRAELKDLVTWSSFGGQLQRNHNALYNVISRAQKRRDVVVHGERIYAATAFRDLEAAGLIDSANAPHKTTLPDAIIGVIRRRNGAADAATIKHDLLEIEEFEPRIRRNGQYVYTVLGRMKDRGDLVKTGEKYHVPGEPIRSGNVVMTLETRNLL